MKKSRRMLPGKKNQGKKITNQNLCRKTQKNICKEGKYSKHIDGPFTYWIITDKY